MSERKPPARLTVVPTIYHQTPDGQAVSAGEPFSRLLASDADADQVRMRLTEAWQALDTGRVPDAGLVFLEYQAPRLQVQPTDAERADTQSRLVEVSYRGDGEPDIFLAPGESTYFDPVDVKRVRVRVRKGLARLAVSLIPR